MKRRTRCLGCRSRKRIQKGARDELWRVQQEPDTWHTPGGHLRRAHHSWLGLAWITLGAQNQNTGGLSLAFAGVWIVLAGVGAWLMRTWWAVLVLPVAFYLGLLVGSVLDTLMLGSAPAGDYFLLGVVIGFFCTIPVVLVSLIATVLSKRVAPRATAA